MKESPETLSKKFLTTCLQLDSKHKIGSIIDVGALLAGGSLKEELVPWLAHQPFFQEKKKFRGISFCHEGKWSVFDVEAMEIVDRNSSIPDNETFVIFDEYRTRGADFKM